MTTPNTVTISEARYRELLISENELCALESGGVDNWSWYSESINNYCNHPSSSDFDPTQPSYESIADMVDGNSMSEEEIADDYDEDE